MILVRLHARDRLPWDYLWLNEVFSMIDNALETMVRGINLVMIDNITLGTVLSHELNER